MTALESDAVLANLLLEAFHAVREYMFKLFDQGVLRNKLSLKLTLEVLLFLKETHDLSFLGAYLTLNLLGIRRSQN